MSMFVDGDEKIHVILREFPMFKDPKNHRWETDGKAASKSKRGRIGILAMFFMQETSKTPPVKRAVKNME